MLSKVLIIIGLVFSILKADGTMTIDNIMYQNQSFNKDIDLSKINNALEYKRIVASRKRLSSWYEAKEYCHALKLGAHDDWYLPNSKEFEKILIVDVAYLLGDYNTFEEYAKVFLAKAKKHVRKISSKRIKSSIGSEVLVLNEFVDTMPYINSKNPLGEFWVSDERDKRMAMTIDIRHAVAWWVKKEERRRAYVLCTRKDAK